MLKVLSVIGTRPEAIKMCPLIKEMEKNTSIQSVVCLTGQHREMLNQVIDIFKTNVNYNLDIMQPRQSLTMITSCILQKIESVYINEKPDLVLVHGDTTTSFVAALAAFYQKIPIGHVEAGLRTYDKYSPFPEEMNRTLTSKIAELHFAPTRNNCENLIKEGIKKDIYITGNTVIDAFSTTVKKNYIFKNSKLNDILADEKKVVLITAHRRENVEYGLKNICLAIKEISYAYPNLNFVYPVHPNPMVRNIVNEYLGGITNVYLLEPIDVEDMHNLLSRSYLVLTDSGGLQEEAPHFGIPVLVLRNETERPEAVKAGTVKVVGTNENNIVNEVKKLLEDSQEYKKMSKAINPYGDGNASQRIVRHILEWRPAMKSQP